MGCCFFGSGFLQNTRFILGATRQGFHTPETRGHTSLLAVPLLLLLLRLFRARASAQPPRAHFLAAGPKNRGVRALFLCLQLLRLIAVPPPQLLTVEASVRRLPLFAAFSLFLHPISSNESRGARRSVCISKMSESKDQDAF